MKGPRPPHCASSQMPPATGTQQHDVQGSTRVPLTDGPGAAGACLRDSGAATMAPRLSQTEIRASRTRGSLWKSQGGRGVQRRAGLPHSNPTRLTGKGRGGRRQGEGRDSPRCQARVSNFPVLWDIPVRHTCCPFPAQEGVSEHESWFALGPRGERVGCPTLGSR